MEINFRENIKEVLKNKRPNLTESSLKTYVSILATISKKLDPNNTNISIFENHEPILELLKDLPPASRKTRLSPLFVITGKDIYQRLMLEDCQVTNQSYREQLKTEKQKEHWITMDEVGKLYDHFFNNTTKIFNNKHPLNYTVINNYLLLACLGGISGLAPRRSQDFSEMRIKDFDESKDNFYKNGVFHFNIYKTSQKYGTQTINVKEKAPAFYKLLQKWIKINPTPYLLFGDTQQKLTSSQITKRFNYLFGKKSSVNNLRHAYLTERYGDIQQEMANDSEMMSHSPATQALYIKH